jgi:hypothetical protein
VDDYALSSGACHEGVVTDGCYPPDYYFKCSIVYVDSISKRAIGRKARGAATIAFYANIRRRHSLPRNVNASLHANSYASFDE